MKIFFETFLSLVAIGSLLLSGFVFYEYFSTEEIETEKIRIVEKIIVEEEMEEKDQDQEQKEELEEESNDISIQDNIEVHTYISKKAEERGYQKRTEALEIDLVDLYGLKIHKDTKDDLHDMLLAAAYNEVKINFVSGYRSYSFQENIFFRKLGQDFSVEDILVGKADTKIDQILATFSFPGYSRHHTGKTVDFSCYEETTLNYGFADTECYKWLAENDFLNAKKYNFYPSYPEGGGNIGPEPEPWEFIWK